MTDSEVAHINLQILQLASQNLQHQQAVNREQWELAQFGLGPAQKLIDETPVEQVNYTQQLLNEAETLKGFVYR